MLEYLCVQVDLPGGFLPVHLCQGAVQQGQCLGVALAHCHIKRRFIEGFQHPFIGGNAVGVGQCRGDFPFVQGLGQLVVRVVKHRGIGKVMVGGKLNRLWLRPLPSWEKPTVMPL